MRRRILGVAVLAVLLAVTLFGIPLAIAVNQIFYGDERGELERIALRGAFAVPADFVTRKQPIALPHASDSVHLAIYDDAGVRFTGQGPETGDTAVRRALRGVIVADASTPRDLVVAVPVFSAGKVIAVSRASSPRGSVRSRIQETWGLMLGIGLLAAACASLFAAAQARRLARPLERLEAMAEDLGAGNFASRASDSGVGEIDRAGQALNRTAERLDDLLARERSFSLHASHQLRTPLTGLRLGLESALAAPDGDLRAAVGEAIVVADHLSRTIDDVLALARGTDPASTTIDMGDVLQDLRRRWEGPLLAAGRALQIDEDNPPQAVASLPAVRQILDVLLDNALRHGQGTVTVTARPSGDAVAVDVADEGSTTGRTLVPTVTRDRVDRETGRVGLALAASLAQAQGGRLLHARTEPRTRFTLLLPGVSESA